MSDKSLAEGSDFPRVDLKLIRASKDALRSVDREDVKFKELVQSVRSNDIINAISLTPQLDEEGIEFYAIVDGAHRVAAAREAGLESIPAMIIRGLSHKQIMETQIVANVQRIESKPIEYTRQIIKIMALDPLMTASVLCAKLGKSLSWLNDRLSLLKLKENLQRLVESNELPLVRAYALAKLPKEEQENFVSQALTDEQNAFLSAVDNRVKDIRTAARAGRIAAGAPVFQPSASFQKIADVKSEIETKTMAKLLVAKFNISDPVEAFTLGLQWTTGLDPDTVSVKKQKFEAQEAAKVQKRKEAEAEREEKKRQKDAAAIAAGNNVAASVGA